MNENKLYYWLSLSRMTDKRLNALLDVFSPEEIWDGLPISQKMKDFIGENHAQALLRFRSESYLDSELSKIRQKDIRIVTRASDEFPKSILQKEVCPPALLYYKGNMNVVNTPCVAIVGTRACSSYGREVAEMLAVELAQAGVTVVSGLATGIDGYAHSAALKSGGKTIAVLGGGLERITPTSNISLSEEIEYSGVVISQYEPSFSPTKYTFPERNRLISALSLGVIVVEAGEKSGALITADFALEQGREVFAVPGNITSIRSKGTNKLISMGAKIVCSANDVLSELRLNIPKKEKITLPPLDFFEEKIYTLLRDGDKTIEDLIELSQLRASEISATLLGMEIKGIIVRVANSYGIR
ncbi:MAG: DNA-processing protein DprA [Clostridia bacterium]|nr:DNA-processing protein DprA [Clostridia bacterium]